jgi:nicotinamide mononucleotide adenylyltransferase
MEDRMKKWALFSGRFDPPNAGHFMTIEKLCCDYVGVVVVVLSDCPEYRRTACTWGEAINIFQWHFRTVLPKIALNKVEVLCYPVHFQKLEKDDILALSAVTEIPFKMFEYVAGNVPVLEHVESLGVITTRFIPRIHVKNVGDEYLFESTRIRHKIEHGESLESQYNIDLNG